MISQIYLDNLEIAVKQGDSWKARDILSSVYIEAYKEGMHKCADIIEKYHHIPAFHKQEAKCLPG